MSSRRSARVDSVGVGISRSAPFTSSPFLHIPSIPRSNSASQVTRRGRFPSTNSSFLHKIKKVVNECSQTIDPTARITNDFRNQPLWNNLARRRRDCIDTPLVTLKRSRKSTFQNRDVYLRTFLRSDFFFANEIRIPRLPSIPWSNLILLFKEPIITKYSN